MEGEGGGREGKEVRGSKSDVGGGEETRSVGGGGEAWEGEGEG